MTDTTNNSWKKTANLELLAQIEIPNTRVEHNGLVEKVDHMITVARMPIFDTYYNSIVVKEGMILHGEVVFGEEVDEYGDPEVIEDNRRYILMETGWQTIEAEALKDAIGRAKSKYKVNVPMHTSKIKTYDFSRNGGPWFKSGRVYELADTDAQRFGVTNCSVARIDQEQPSDSPDYEAEYIFGVICVTTEALEIVFDGPAHDLPIQQSFSKEPGQLFNYLASVVALEKSEPVFKAVVMNGRKYFLPCMPGADRTGNAANPTVLPPQVRKLPMPRRGQ